eukprot:1558435-Rhodomonas_salina.1
MRGSDAGGGRNRRCSRTTIWTRTPWTSAEIPSWGAIFLSSVDPVLDLLRVNAHTCAPTSAQQGCDAGTP